MNKYLLLPNRPRKTVFVFFLFFLSVAMPYAQESTNSGGGTLVDGSVSVGYSVGQIQTKEFSSSSGSCSPGVQQGYKVITVGIDYKHELTWDVSVFPNPARDHLTLSFTGEEVDMQYTATLTDINGNTVFVKEINQPECRIPVSYLTDAVYFMLITQNGRLIKLIKIVKQ